MIGLPLTAVVFGQFLPCQLGPLAPSCLQGSTCISLTAPLERSTCPNQRSLLSLKMRSRSSSSTFTSSSIDLTVATSSDLLLQICLIMALSFRCKRCRLVLVNGQVSLVHRFRKFGGQQPAGPGGDGETRVVSAKCLNGHLLRPGGTSPPGFSFTRFIVEQCLLKKTSCI